MKDISLIDVIYTGGMLFIAFYGAILITKIISKYIIPKEPDNDDK